MTYFAVGIVMTPTGFAVWTMTGFAVWTMMTGFAVSVMMTGFAQRASTWIDFAVYLSQASHWWLQRGYT
jgi:hypothetical protein